MDRKDKTERATGLSRRTREEIPKRGIKLTALRFQTGGRHLKSPGLPSGATQGYDLIPTESAFK